jgi:L-asparaginase
MNEGKRSITLLSTGGTIEKTYDPLHGVLSNDVSVLEVLLAQLELEGVELRHVELMNKDSADMADADHRIIAEHAMEYGATCDGVVVVHGTDRLAETGDAIVEMSGSAPGIPIVLTGAMRPWILRNSDAQQNLTEALMAVQLLKPGVYVCMHNKVIAFPGVVKDVANLCFVSARSAGA